MRIEAHFNLFVFCFFAEHFLHTRGDKIPDDTFFHETVSTIHSPSPKPAISLTNVSWLLGTRKCAMKNYLNVFSCLANGYRTMTSGWRGAPNFRRYGRELVSKSAISLKRDWGDYRRTTHDWVLNPETGPSQMTLHENPGEMARMNTYYLTWPGTWYNWRSMHVLPLSLIDFVDLVQAIL